jgi:hypothetical protein
MLPGRIVVPPRRISLRRVLERPSHLGRLRYCSSGTSQDPLDCPDKAQQTSLGTVYATAVETASYATS